MDIKTLSQDQLFQMNRNDLLQVFSITYRILENKVKFDKEINSLYIEISKLNRKLPIYPAIFLGLVGAFWGTKFVDWLFDNIGLKIVLIFIVLAVAFILLFVKLLDMIKIQIHSGKVNELRSKIIDLQAQQKNYMSTADYVYAYRLMGNLFDLSKISDLYNIISNRRADTLKEALNVMDTLRYQRSMTQMQQSTQFAAEMAAQDAARARRDAADALWVAEQTKIEVETMPNVEVYGSGNTYVIKH